MRSLGLLLLLAAAVGAQDLGKKAPPQKEAIALVNATIHTVGGATHAQGYVLFEKGRILEVGAGSREFPEGVRVVDCAGLHAYPGFIAANTQLGITEIGAVRASRDFNETGGVTPEVRAAVAVNPDSTLLPVARSNGVLAAAVFPSGGMIPGRASILRLEGWTWEEMALRDDAGLVVQWPFARPIRARWMTRSEEEQAEATRKGLDRIKEVFARAEAYRDARAADPALPVDIRLEAMLGALPGRGGASPAPLPVFLQAQEVDQIVSAVSFAASRGLRAVVVGGRDALLCADLLKRHDVGVMLQGTIVLPRRADSDFDEPFRLPARLQAAGVRWCLTSGEEPAHERNLPYSAALAVAHGLDRDTAIRSITLSVAEILGVADELGSLETGKSATLFLCDGDPLEIPTRVVRAFIDGREVDLSNKQTMLYEKYREKYRQSGLIR
ncbi:MAG: amidohydrolase family protein [Planctomycetaceae bacterium]